MIILDIYWQYCKILLTLSSMSSKVCTFSSKNEETDFFDQSDEEAKLIQKGQIMKTKYVLMENLQERKAFFYAMVSFSICYHK